MEENKSMPLYEQSKKITWQATLLTNSVNRAAPSKNCNNHMQYSEVSGACQSDSVPFSGRYDTIVPQILQQNPQAYCQYLARFLYYTYIPQGFTLDPLTWHFPIGDPEKFQELYIVSFFGHEQQFNIQPDLPGLNNWIFKN